ncbi:MAG TPA: ferredoxin [Pseudonocardiaceae bacterium]|jgi:ferredoxin
MTVHADTTICIGAGQCALRAPAVFDQSDDDDTVIVLDVEPGAEHGEAVREAVELCPSGAISVSSAS